MLIYLAAPYSSIHDKDALMAFVMKVSGTIMLQNPGWYIVSPLFNHYSLPLVPGMGGDYKFWGDYSRELLSRCDRLLVLKIDGSYESVGVSDEILTANTINIPIKFITVDKDFKIHFTDN